MPTHIEPRFWGTTRGRIIMLLRRESRTVDELARLLNLTDNAVRAHLATLERDRLIRQGGMRPSASKPAVAYELTQEAEKIFPKAYVPVMRQLLEVLGERMPPAELIDVMKMTGQRIAATHELPQGSLRSRVEEATTMLNELGGLAELEEHDGEYVIQGYSCPLAAIIPGHPEVCCLAEALLAEVIGAPVHEECSRTEPIHCRFAIPRSE